MLAFCCDICLRRSNLCAICVAAYYKRVWFSSLCNVWLKLVYIKSSLCQATYNKYTYCVQMCSTWPGSYPDIFHSTLFTLHLSLVTSMRLSLRAHIWFQVSNTNTVGVSLDTCRICHRIFTNTNTTNTKTQTQTQSVCHMILVGYSTMPL